MPKLPKYAAPVILAAVVFVMIWVLARSFMPFAIGFVTGAAATLAWRKEI